jgi:hypothetical protein
MLWYGFDATSDRAILLDAVHEGIAGGAWNGEVSLRAEDLSEVGFDPGVLRRPHLPRTNMVAQVRPWCLSCVRV